MPAYETSSGSSLIQTAKQTLVSRLEGKLPDNLDKKMPDELVVLILEYIMIEPHQPVRIKATHAKPTTICDRRPNDPSIEKFSLFFHRSRTSERLLAMAREAYFRVNTVRIDVPAERSPTQVLRSKKFVMPWATDIYSMELVQPLVSERYRVGPFRGSRTRVETVLHRREISRVVAVLGSLKQAFPNLRRLTLMLTVEDDFSSIYTYSRYRTRSNSGELCPLLMDSSSQFADVYVGDIAPALRGMDLNYAAFQWCTSCGHVQCTKLLGQIVEADRDVVRVMEGSDHSIAVLRERKMPSWA